MSESMLHCLKSPTGWQLGIAVVPFVACNLRCFDTDQIHRHCRPMIRAYRVVFAACIAVISDVVSPLDEKFN